MADKKVTALTDLGDNIASADLFHVVDDPSGTPINKKIAAEDVFNNIPSFLGLKQASQTITADGSTATAVDVTSANVYFPKFLSFSAIKNKIIGHPTRKPIE